MSPTLQVGLRHPRPAHAIIGRAASSPLAGAPVGRRSQEDAGSAAHLEHLLAGSSREPAEGLLVGGDLLTSPRSFSKRGRARPMRVPAPGASRSPAWCCHVLLLGVDYDS